MSEINHRCQECHAEYQRGWRKLSKERGIRAAYNRGIEEARDAIVAALSSVGDREMNGWTASSIARGVSVDA